MEHLKSTAILTALLFGVLLPTTVTAHCDTYKGPVITAAKIALEKGNVTPVLKWVKEKDDATITEAFKKTLAIRTKGPEAKELADTWFFETLVRIHRAGEGEPYTGIKDEPIEPIVALSDKALETGHLESLVNPLSDALKQGLNERFSKAFEARKVAYKSVENGREFVEAYVVFVHYLEKVHSLLNEEQGHHGEQKSEAHHGQ